MSRFYDERESDELLQLERELCPDCNGLNIDLVSDTGGSCPSCFGGYR